MYPSPINRLRSLCGQKSQVNLIGSRGKCLPINNRKQSSGISFQIRTRISISMSLMYFIMCIICLLITIGSGTKFFYIYYGRLVPGKKKSENGSMATHSSLSDYITTVGSGGTGNPWSSSPPPTLSFLFVLFVTHQVASSSTWWLQEKKI